jgi:hypothetical protein
MELAIGELARFLGISQDEARERIATRLFSAGTMENIGEVISILCLLQRINPFLGGSR